MPFSKSLGVCYYPEHWSEKLWAADAAKMGELGISYARIGEFAWSKMEPTEGRHDWGWLDRAVETLGKAGIKVILCTPTPTPPKWLTDKYPGVLRHGQSGLPIKHGSRRHVSVASKTYRKLSAGITEALVDRYGENPIIAGWQTDNEFGCHDSTLSYGPEDREAFSAWLEEKYGDIGVLNQSWGAEFWSQTYDSFRQVDLPHRLQAEPNPAHWLDFRRFFSDMTVEFNREQTDIIRLGSPGRFVTHNAMAWETGYDHWDLSADLDFMSWDSYPLGFLQRLRSSAPDEISENEALRYEHIGHPDILAFHHDLYRSQSGGGHWVMEQQPGPVNWAAWNPAPADGAVRAWTLEAMAHGASTVCYFRWRQAAWSQEQMHTGLFTPWNEPDQAVSDLGQLSGKLRGLGLESSDPDPSHTVGLYYDYEAAWFFEAMRQGAGLDPCMWSFGWYRALRQLGLNVEFFGPDPDRIDNVRDLKLLIFPVMPISRPGLLGRLCRETQARLVFGPRSGSRTASMSFSAPTPESTPGAVGAPPYLTDGERPLFPGLSVRRVESLSPQNRVSGKLASGANFTARGWVEHLALSPKSELESIGAFEPQAARRSGLQIAGASSGRFVYLGFQPDRDSMAMLARWFAEDLKLDIVDLSPDLRLRRTQDSILWFNFGPEPAPLPSSHRGEILEGMDPVLSYSATVTQK